MNKRPDGQILTDRQKEVARLIALGFSLEEIGEKLFISKNTAETHKNEIYRQLKIHSSIDLVWQAILRGYVTAEEYCRIRQVSIEVNHDH